MIDKDTDYLMPMEIAAKLRLSKMTVYRMIESGELPSIRIGRSIRVPVKNYEIWLLAHRTGITI